MKKHRILIITILSLILLTGFAACKRGYQHRFDEFDQQALINRIASRLDLSEFQKTELGNTVEEIVAKAREMHADHEVRHQELSDLIRQETISRETVDRMTAEKLYKIRELADLAADRLIAFHATLTPDQREKLAQHIEDHASKERFFFQR